MSAEGQSPRASQGAEQAAGTTPESRIPVGDDEAIPNGGLAEGTPAEEPLSHEALADEALVEEALEGPSGQRATRSLARINWPRESSLTV